jgi:hypothetical protein
MTSLICWTGVDSRKTASIYMASDSRISNGTKQWDFGRKLFASRLYPEIFGYCGDVLFPTQVLSQIVGMIDGNILFDNNDSPSVKTAKVVDSLKRSLITYPFEIKFDILYGTRYLSEMVSEFQVSKLSYNNRNLVAETLQLPMDKSSLVISLGTGKTSIEKYVSKWERSDTGSTSRTYFSAFCESLNSGDDKNSGGSPQLVGIYRISTGKTFGIIHDKKRFLNGHILPDNINTNNISWHNNLLEICDGDSLKLNAKAKPQPRPKNVDY